MKLERTLIETETFAYGDYRVDIVTFDNEMEAWLYRKNYGVKSLMWGTKKRYYNTVQERFITIRPYEFLEMVEDNIDDYIEGYREEYEDE